MEGQVVGEAHSRVCGEQAISQDNQGQQWGEEASSRVEGQALAKARRGR